MPATSRRLRLVGNANTTPGVAHPITILVTDPNNVGDDTNGLTVTFNGAANADQPALQILKSDGTTPVAEVLQAYAAIYGGKLGSSIGVFNNPACLDATATAIGIKLADGAKIYMGTGDPGTTFTGTGVKGDVFLRRDGSAGASFYMCSVAGTPGTWVALN